MLMNKIKFYQTVGLVMSNVKRQQTILSPITFHEYATQRLPQEKKIYRENRKYFEAFKTYFTRTK